ncbi:hypothetical protein MK526_03435 [Abiotrophia defectiva]|uniref:hypothetical protein n=1 Tax=Abiotrophia defectiva TaxID=46125 RepID=UPI00228141D9|nr:hypothetical protein [Abiotrophia defectiva]MCY7224814.1 hypothetical protein [Abiotrophia defectiva]
MNNKQKKAVRFGWPVDRKIPRNSREWTMFWLSIVLTLVISWAFYLSRWPVPVRKAHFIFHDDVNRLMDLKMLESESFSYLLTLLAVLIVIFIFYTVISHLIYLAFDIWQTMKGKTSKEGKVW